MKPYLPKIEKIIFAVTLLYLVFILSANKNIVSGQTETPTVNPTETSAPTFTPTPTSASATATPSSPTNTPGPTAKPSPTTVKRTPTPRATLTPTFTPTVTPTEAPTPTPAKLPGFIAQTGGGWGFIIALVGLAFLTAAYFLKKRLSR